MMKMRIMFDDVDDNHDDDDLPQEFILTQREN